MTESATPPPAAHPTLPRLGLAAVLSLTVALDAWLLAHRHVKLEVANAFELTQHALIRDGQIVLASTPGAYADALHTWAFHLLLLLSPRLEVAAAALNLVHYAAVALLYVGAQRRWGVAAGAVAAGMLAVAPVSPILSKHVISTAFVPLVMPLFAFAVLDLAGGAGRRALGRAVAWGAFLLALNDGHVVFVVSLVAAMAATRTWRPPAWSVAAALVALSSGLFAGVWRWGTPAWRTMWLGSRDAIGLRYPDAVTFVRRLLFVEHGMIDLLPNLWLLVALAIAALVVLLVDRGARPPGLVALLAPAALLPWAHPEASVAWQTPLFLLVAWAVRRPAVHALAWAHLLVAPVTQAWLYTHPPADSFFVLASLNVRYELLDELERLGMHQGDLPRTVVAHPVGENDIPATLPGLAYLAERVRPLPPGDSGRCARIAPDATAPEGATDVATGEAAGQRVVTFRDPTCAEGFTIAQGPVVVLDLSTGRIVEHAFPGALTAVAP